MEKKAKNKTTNHLKHLGILLLVFILIDQVLKLNTPARISDLTSCTISKIGNSSNNIYLPTEFHWDHEIKQVPEYTNKTGGKGYVQANVYTSSSNDQNSNKKLVNNFRSSLTKNCWILVRQVNEVDWLLFAYEKNGDFIQFSWYLDRNSTNQNNKYLLEIHSTIDLK